MNKELKQYIGGIIPDDVDLRDYDAETLMGSNLNIPIDWDKGYDVIASTWPDMPNQNQFGQFSCVGRSWAHYKQIIQVKDTGEKTILSAKSIYNPIAVPGVGSRLRDGGMRTVNYGVNKESTVSSDGTEQEITASFDFKPYATEANFYKNRSIASVYTQSFDTLAKMIVLNDGFVSGWGTHAQYFKAFGKLNGKKFLKTHNSYGSGSDIYYFEGIEPLFSIWTAIDEKNIEANSKPKAYLLENIEYGESGQKVADLRTALIQNGWIEAHKLSDVYDDKMAELVFKYQLANLNTIFTIWAWFWAKYRYKGRLVDVATRNCLNQLI